MKSNFPLEKFFDFVARIHAHRSTSEGIRGCASTLFKEFQ
jgi:hypothetical protein